MGESCDAMGDPLRSTRWPASALLAGLAIACASGAPPAEKGAGSPAATRLPTVLAERYAGMLPCADCGGTFAELDLYVTRGDASPATYHLRETHLATREGDVVVESDGVWRATTGTRADPAAELVRLDPTDPARARVFARAAGRWLRQLDRDAAEIDPGSPHVLRWVDVAALPPRVAVEADAANPIEISVGQPLAVKLPSNRTAKYHWTLASSGTNLLARVGPPAYGPDRAAAGPASGVEVWLFTAQSAGEQTLRFDLMRPWEKPTAIARTVEFRVVVAAPAAAAPPP